MNAHGEASYCAFLYDEPGYYEGFIAEILEAKRNGEAVKAKQQRKIARELTSLAGGERQITPRSPYVR